jgi:hypothetical protein
MVPTTKSASSTTTGEASGSVEDILMGQPLGEDDGPDSAADDDDAFSKSLDLTSYVDDPKYRGVRLLGQDKCRVIV